MPRTTAQKRSGRTASRRSAPAGEDKRRLILRAAVKVFAERGYHGCRIADIAREAGVAYGLVYHYFENKEALLTSVFEESWNLFAAVVHSVGESDAHVSEKLRQIVSVALDAYRAHPHAVQVMILEIARSPFFLEKKRLDAFEATFRVTADLISEAQRRGEVRPDVDPMHAAYLVFGAIEMILTGFVLGTLDVHDDDAFESAKHDAVRVITAGIVA